MEEQVQIKVPPKLFAETQEIIQRISEQLDGDFISYWISDSSRIVSEDALSLIHI